MENEWGFSKETVEGRVWEILKSVCSLLRSCSAKLSMTGAHDSLGGGGKEEAEQASARSPQASLALLRSKLLFKEKAGL